MRKDLEPTCILVVSKTDPTDRLWVFPDHWERDTEERRETLFRPSVPVSVDDALDIYRMLKNP